jgi:hypothetical protein
LGATYLTSNPFTGATRRQIAATAVDLANDGAQYGQNSVYQNGNLVVPAGTPKCNIYVNDVLAQSGANTPLNTANNWANANVHIANWDPIPIADAQPGDVIAWQAAGHGHVGIVDVVGANPSALAAGGQGVVQNPNFWTTNNPVTVRRWTGY